MRYVARGCMYCEGECNKECLKEFKEQKVSPQDTPAIIEYTPIGSTMVRNLMEMYNSMSIEEKNEVITKLSK